MRLSLALLALSVGAAFALGAETARARALPEPLELFRFSAGSELFAAPGVGADGAVYVGTSDGYLHALENDGRYRWSYTVKGRIVAPPLEDRATRRIFTATSEAKLYCFEPDSRLRWVFPLPVAPRSELLLTQKGTLLFVGKDEHLYGVTTSGALVLRLAAPGARSSPALLDGGRSAVVLGDQLGIVQGYGYEKAALPAVFGPSARLALARDRGILVCEAGEARARGGSGRTLDVRSDCLAPPVRASGFFAIAEASGDVRLVYDDGAVQSVALGAVPKRPVWDDARRRLVLSTASGVVRVLEIPLPEGAP